jgi:hypothetical protein
VAVEEVLLLFDELVDAVKYLLVVHVP